MEQRLTDEEKLTLKTGAFGAVFLVSNADPGFIGMLRESFAASGAISGASGLVKEALTEGPLPRLAADSPLAVEAGVLPALTRAMGILRARAPQEAENYRATVLAAADQVARAHQGVGAAETAVIEKVRAALDAPA
jgi:hypothetical protein